MNLFKKKQTIQTDAPAMPPELNDYYQAEKRQRSVVTWALGFATLVVTIAIAFGLFLGARWVVTKARKPAKTPIAIQNQPETTKAPVSSDKPNSPSSNTDQTPAVTPGESVVTNVKPQTSSATTNLPNTGPTETLAVFALVTTTGTVAHTILRKKRSM